MFKVALLTTAVFWGWIVAADKLPILPKGNWSEACRRMTNELGGRVNAGGFLSLKGSFSAPAEKQLFWTVTSYKDKDCSSFHDANRYTYECVSSDGKKLGKFLCTQTKWEKSSELGKWTETPMVDHAGHPNVGKSYVTARGLKSGKIELTQVDFESEEGMPVLLSKSSENVSAPASLPTDPKVKEFVYCSDFKICADLRTYEETCRKDQKESDCRKFVSAFKKLAVKKDCKRKSDTEFVPSVWVCDEDPAESSFPKIFERSARTLSTLKFPFARKFYGSDAFRSVLDGDIAEEHSDSSRKASGK